MSGKREKVTRRFTLKKAWIHLKTIMIHKYWVFIYMRKCGMPIRGLLHDMSKFSPAEFFTNVKYVEKGISPIDIQKKEVGYSFPWLHHKGHNPHHYEFWMDRFDDGCYVHRMPFKYMVECMCDQLAANKAYNGKHAIYVAEKEWWEKQREIRNMHPDCKTFLDEVIFILYMLENNCDVLHYRAFDGKLKEDFEYEYDVFKRKFLRNLYRKIVVHSGNDSCIKIKQPREGD